MVVQIVATELLAKRLNIKLCDSPAQWRCQKFFTRGLAVGVTSTIFWPFFMFFYL